MTLISLVICIAEALEAKEIRISIVSKTMVRRMRMSSLLWVCGGGLSCGTRVAQLLAVRQRHGQELSANLPVLQRPDEDFHFHAGCKSFGFPTLPQQTWRRAHFNRPFRGLTFRIGNCKENPAMRIRPVEFFDGAFHRHRLAGIKHGKGMMRDS